LTWDRGLSIGPPSWVWTLLYVGKKM